MIHKFNLCIIEKHAVQYTAAEYMETNLPGHEFERTVSWSVCDPSSLHAVSE